MGSLMMVVMVLLQACSTEKTDYELIATFQDHSVPEAAIAATDTTRVLVVVPHADDETIAGGLIALLRDQGASIHLLTLCGHDALRTRELDCAAATLGIDRVEIAGFVNNTWEAVMHDSITFWYDHQDRIREAIAEKISSFNPHFLITYDAEIGAYGHPEHRISAAVTEGIFMENKDQPAMAAHKIFQITLSEALEQFLVAHTPGYELARRRTGSQGLPQPDVSVDITGYWPVKNAAAQCHQSQQKTLKRFFIVYDEKNRDAHVKAFGREYYRVVE